MRARVFESKQIKHSNCSGKRLLCWSL